MSEGLLVCGVTANMMAQTSVWNKPKLYWCVLSEFQGISPNQVIQCFEDIFGAWNEATLGALSFEAVDSPSACDIQITTGPIDQQFQVLAWSELPPGDDRRLTQRYDSRDRFTVQINPQQSGLIGLHEVGCHEVGHALGLDHDQPNSGALMQPTYKPGLWKPTPRDLARIQSLYKANQPPPTEEEDNAIAYIASLNKKKKIIAMGEYKRIPIG